MQKKNSLAIILVFVLIAVIRTIGIENIPFMVIVTLLIICIIGMFFSMLRFKGNKAQRKYLLLMTLIITLLISVLIIAVSIENNYPQISKQYKPVFIIILAILFLSLLITIFFNAIHKHNNSNKFKNK